MIEEKELLAEERFEEIANDYQQSATPKGNRAVPITTARRRTSTADLMKAHLALMEMVAANKTTSGCYWSRCNCTGDIHCNRLIYRYRLLIRLDWV